MKEEYNRRYQLAQRLYNEATAEDQEAGVVSEPVALKVRTQVCKEFWDLESQEFRDQIAQQAEDAHAEGMAKWKANQEAPKTPQQYHQ